MTEKLSKLSSFDRR